MIGDLESHDNICHSLVRRSGHAVLSVADRLAPEDPFPAGLGDCVQATRWAHTCADELGTDARLAHALAAESIADALRPDPV